MEEIITLALSHSLQVVTESLNFQDYSFVEVTERHFARPLSDVSWHKVI